MDGQTDRWREGENNMSPDPSRWGEVIKSACMSVSFVINGDISFKNFLFIQQAVSAILKELEK